MSRVRRVLDLFAGCGGMSLGFQEAGFEIAAAVDHWPEAVKVYQANFEHPALCFDLSDVGAAVAELAPHTAGLSGIIGGPPCQDFSSAGYRVEGERAMLTEAFARITARLRPGFFVMENVARACSSTTWGNALAILKAAGYSTTVVVENAMHHGVPQTRARAFAFGVFDSPQRPPAGTGNVIWSGDDPCREFHRTLTASRTEPISVRDYLGADTPVEHYFMQPRYPGRRGIYTVDQPSQTIRGNNRPVPPGYRPHPLDSAPPEGVRPLTTLERARVQTFPPDFVFPTAKTNAEQMIGNAVPPLLARDVARSVRNALDRQEPR